MKRNLDSNKVYGSILLIICMIMLSLPLFINFTDSSRIQRENIKKINLYIESLKIEIMEETKNNAEFIPTNEWLKDFNSKLNINAMCEQIGKKNGKLALNNCEVTNNYSKYCYYDNHVTSDYNHLDILEQ